MSPRAPTAAASATASGFGWQGAGGCSARAMVVAISGRSSTARRMKEFLSLDSIIFVLLGGNRAGHDELGDLLAQAMAGAEVEPEMLAGEDAAQRRLAGRGGERLEGALRAGQHLGSDGEGEIGLLEKALEHGRGGSADAGVRARGGGSGGGPPPPPGPRRGRGPPGGAGGVRGANGGAPRPERQRGALGAGRR